MRKTMKLSTPRYSLCLLFQLVFIIFDLVFNCISLFPRNRDSLLIIFIFQDLFLILSITAMLMMFFATYLFQAGLVELLLSKFKTLLIVSVIYLVTCLVLHSWWLIEKWNSEEKVSTAVLVTLFTIQRCMSPWYYFFYKRAALRISDPRFYEDIDWINQQLQVR